jgi:hypothetical protein
MNQWNLFETSDAALECAKYICDLAKEHAPFFVYGIWKTPMNAVSQK